jgi:uncharacterized protein YhaN
MDLLLLLLVIALFLGAGFLVWRFRQEARSLRARYAPIVDADAAVAAAQSKLKETQQRETALVADKERERAQLIEEYTKARATHDALKKEINILEENLEDISFGLYKPHFTFQTSEEYKTKLEAIRDQERLFLREGRAAVCAVKWQVGGSAKEGQRMAKQTTKVLLRAFNGECDAAVANVSWNNITKMEQRVRKACSAINDLGTVMQISITDEYLNLKLSELRLTHEYEDKRNQEKEEQRKIREQIREEEKAQREIEKAQEEAEKEEDRYQKALEQARAEAALATGSKLDKLSEHIQSLEAKLEEAHQRKERAVARAQLTKSGFVYVISNIGSFGESVVKVGMTRRMEPMERIAELGDASVPFPFDLHAMLYSDNAPELEAALHQFLGERRVNLVNPRKEFYHRVDMVEVEEFVRKRGLSAQFIKLAEAREYRETLALRESDIVTPVAETPKFPATPFESAS